MFCPHCAKEIPDGSQFCLHCGRSIKKSSSESSSTNAPTQWEYKDFVYSWSHKETWYRTSRHNDTQVRVDVWMNYQSKISAELQKWYDEGWQPVGEVGPSSIKIHQYTEWDGIAAVWWTIFTAGLALIIAPFLRESFTEPTEFRLQMRRPKAM